MCVCQIVCVFMYQSVCAPVSVRVIVCVCVCVRVCVRHSQRAQGSQTVQIQ